ncbi:YARHG domain-containing protein [Mucilaginibacter sp. AW1-3]
MKPLVAFCILAISACLASSGIAVNVPVIKVPKTVKNADVNTIPGSWVGMFVPDKDFKPVNGVEREAWDYQNKINISIDKIDGSNVTGHSIVAGNTRPFTGTVTKDRSMYTFVLKQSGDDKYDGVFTFYIDDDLKLTGTWTATNKINIPAWHYTLQKMVFKYDPSVKLTNSHLYIDWVKRENAPSAGEKYVKSYNRAFSSTTNDVFLFNASAQPLTKDEVSNLKKTDLFILRNSIYARHGYAFKTPQLRAYFDSEQWYIPMSTDVDKDLTEIEKKNVDLLMRYEKNAKDYYRSFGR